jgi:hypothetical protein
MNTYTKAYVKKKSILQTPKEAKLDEFVLRMFMKEERIKVYPMFGDQDDKKEFGYIPSKDKLLIPYDFPRASHEIAHMVEMNNPERWTKTDWGFPKIDNFMRGSANGFFAAFAREIRVKAIEDHIRTEPRCTEKDTDHMYWGPEAKKKLPFGRFKTFQDLEVWADDLREKTFKAWSPERIEAEWDIRLEHIQNWMETK